LGKFDSRTNECIFLGYALRIKGYRCYNKKLGKIIESANVKLDEARHQKVKAHVQTEEPCFKEEEEGEENEQEESKHQNRKTPSRFVGKNHSEYLILGDKDMGVQTRIRLANAPEHANFSLLYKI
jgi:hypothetical protein